MSQQSATAQAHSNIAFVKYWGNVDPLLRLPYNDSLSMNLSDAVTTTTVTFDPGLDVDSVSIDGRPLDGPALRRVVDHLDRIRSRAGMGASAVVESTNTFPMGTGIASSASGFAALTVAAAAAAGLDPSERELSTWARRGSGSAARSVPGGFTYWQSGARDEDSYASSLAPPDHWDLRDIVAVVSAVHKSVGSGGGHDLAPSSPFFSTRLGQLGTSLKTARRSVLERDLSTLGPLLEEEALCLHAVALTSRPPILYWSPQTVALLSDVPRWRSDGIAVYFTLDAGPNVHLICESCDEQSVVERLRALRYVDRVIVNAPAGPARRIA